MIEDLPDIRHLALVLRPPSPPLPLNPLKGRPARFLAFTLLRIYAFPFRALCVIFAVFAVMMTDCRLTIEDLGIISVI